ncbi:MAG: nucleotidyltransferase substrate binding protein [Defluviitaleaceae bacterium]|nr:nucleotidyltransferase substrate binding protein [Defluviitaleaceae bacterium]
MGFDMDIRWKQRFQNFGRAFTLLRSALECEDIENYSDLELEGVIQRFEYTFELAWKTFKDYLEYSGIETGEASPRNIIKKCAAANIFDEAEIDPQIFVDMMVSRNKLSHTYDFEIFKTELHKIKTRYLSELENAYLFFIKKELDENAGLRA